MKLTPLDLRKQTFGKAFRGFDPDEVRSFLDLVARQWEEVTEEVRLADERVAAMEHKLKHYERVEVALQEALETARESARRAEASAGQRAKLIVEEAELKALRVVSDAETERQQLRQDAVKLTHRQNEIAARLRSFLMSELEILAQFQGDDPVGFIKLFPAGAAGALPPAQSAGESPAAAAEAAPEETPAEHAESAPEEAHVAQVHPVELPEEAPPEVTPTLEDEHELAAAWVEDELAPDVVEEETVTPHVPFEPYREATVSAADPALPPAPVEESAAEPGGEPRPETPAPAFGEERPLHQILADRLRGDSAPSEPSVWQRFRGASDGSEAGGWSLRSLVTGEAEPEAPASVPADEREKVRKMLEDMD
jgi:cell division initiation protein